MPRVELSVVAPMYNESANVDRFVDRIIPVLDRLGLSYEVICVNDGSRDDTLARLLAQRRRTPSLKVLSLARNFGKEVALTAGIDYASGEAVVPIDADLQDPPEVIAELVAAWRSGYDVVYATRRSRRGESWLKRFTANAFYRVLDRVTEIPIPRNTGDFRLMDRRVVEALRNLPERTRFMKGLFAWVGFRQTAILYDRAPRHAGRTTWNYWRLWNFALDGITSFSTVPLRVWTYVGLAVSLFAFLFAAFLVVRTLLHGSDVPGYASLMVVILFLGGIQLITLGVIGEYIGRIYTEVKGRPLYLVREAVGFDEREAAAQRPAAAGPAPVGTTGR
ncbi:MAG TPA: glycosyltransferase family 2 protein [Thermodesulfobacteriota bacterium]